MCLHISLSRLTLRTLIVATPDTILKLGFRALTEPGPFSARFPAIDALKLSYCQRSLLSPSNIALLDLPVRVEGL